MRNWAEAGNLPCDIGIYIFHDLTIQVRYGAISRSWFYPDRAIIVLELKEYKTRVIRFNKTIKLILTHFYFVNLDKMNLSDNITKISRRESNIYNTCTKRVNSLKAIKSIK